MHNSYKVYCAFILLVVVVNVNLGVPYEAILKKSIERGYAGNQTEVIRQALLNYDRMMDKEERELVAKAVEIEMSKVKSGEIKTKSFAEIKEKFKW